jgi:LPS O-antigen subunit length determinant protein (WzzB/FepE family)
MTAVMTNKEITPKSGARLPQGWQASSSDEIDLRELLSVLWREKVLILLTTVLFAAFGVGYALTAPQQWSTKAVITDPKPEDLLPMRKVAIQAGALGLQGFPSGKVLYQEFIQEFNAYENRRDYLKASPLFAEQAKELGLDDKAHRRWLRDWAKLVSAQPVDKKGEEPGIEITFSAPTAEASLVMLEGYIDYIIKLQQQRVVHRLSEERTVSPENYKNIRLCLQKKSTSDAAAPCAARWAAA